MEQVRKVCADLKPGDMPDIPPFLRRNPDNSGGVHDWKKPAPEEPEQVAALELTAAE
jgi:hypothetical protein